MPDIVPIAGAAAGGLFPSLAWLWFWLREEADHPEPRKLIALRICGRYACGHARYSAGRNW